MTAPLTQPAQVMYLVLLWHDGEVWNRPGEIGHRGNRVMRQCHGQRCTVLAPAIGDRPVDRYLGMVPRSRRRSSLRCFQGRSAPHCRCATGRRAYCTLASGLVQRDQERGATGVRIAFELVSPRTSSMGKKPAPPAAGSPGIAIAGFVSAVPLARMRPVAIIPAALVAKLALVGLMTNRLQASLPSTIMSRTEA